MQQLTIILEGTEGALVKITTLLAHAEINLTDIDAEEIDDVGVLQLQVEEADFEQAVFILREAGFQVMPREVVLVKIEDKPGGLAALAVRLSEAEINVRSMRIVKREEGYCLAAIVPEEADKARKVLGDVVH